MIFYIAAQAAAVAQQAILANERRRIELGLPPQPPPPPKTEAELKAERALEREGNFLMMAWLIIGGVLFTAPWAMMIYCAIKLAFAAKGVKWP